MARTITYNPLHGLDEAGVPDAGLRFRKGETKTVTDKQAAVLLSNPDFVDADTGKNARYTCTECGLHTREEASSVALDIVSLVDTDEQGRVTGRCCRNFLETGVKCTDILNRLGVKPNDDGSVPQEALEHLWDNTTTQSPSSSPASPLPASKKVAEIAAAIKTAAAKAQTQAAAQTQEASNNARTS